jgi:pyruvate dehydrogenase (quinone)
MSISRSQCSRRGESTTQPLSGRAPPPRENRVRQGACSCDFAAIARAAGLFGATVEQVDELEGALEAAFVHDGPALVDVRAARQELALPPKIALEQAKGFTLYATKTILSGGANEIIELAKTNLRQLASE